jgi:oligopeptide transport system substrate-binding protein
VATTDPSFVDPLFVSRQLGVQALSEDTLEIQLEFAAPYFPTLLALPEFRPVPEEAIAQNADWTKADTFLTNGPWALRVWNRSIDTITLIRNPLWPDKPTGNIERIDIPLGRTQDAIIEVMTNGSLDFSLLDSATAQKLKQSKPDLVKSATGLNVTVLGFSIERDSVQKDAFRRALSQAIDRQALVDQVLASLAQPMSRFTPPGTIGGPSAQPDNSGYMPDAAKAALVEASFTGCKLKEKIDFMIDDTPQSAAIAQVLLADWQSVLGCASSTFNIIKAPAATLQLVAHGMINTSDKDSKPRPTMWLYTWTPDYPDANGFTGDALHCTFGFLRMGAACGDAEIAIDNAFVETDPAKRADDYNKAENVWFGVAGTFPVAPLYVALNSVGVQPRLTGTTVDGPFWFDAWTIAH